MSLNVSADARGKFVSGAKVLAAVPSISQPKEEFTRIDLKLAETGRSCQQTMKSRVLEEWFSEMVNRNLFRFWTTDNLVYMLSLFSLLRLIHVIGAHER